MSQNSDEFVHVTTKNKKKRTALIFEENSGEVERHRDRILEIFGWCGPKDSYFRSL